MDDLDMREVYQGSRYREVYEDEINNLDIDSIIKDRSIRFIGDLDISLSAGLSPTFVALGFLLFVMTSGGSVKQNDLEHCYNIVKHKCGGHSKDGVIRNIVRYYLFVRQSVYGVYRRTDM